MNSLLRYAAIAFAATAASASADAVKLDAVTLAPKPVYINGPFRNFVEEVNERFAGEVEIDWRGGPEVMPPFKQAEGVRNGAVDMTYTSPSYYQGLVPTSGTMNLSFKTYEEIAATGYHERMTELHAERDLIYLGEIPATELNFFIYMRDEIHDLDDLKGKRIRVFPTLLPLVKALGAEPIVLPMGEIFTALERGAIDGFMQGPLGQAEQFGDLVKTVVAPGVYRAGFPVLVNSDIWAEIAPGVQDRLTSFLREDFAPRMDTIWADPIAESQAQMREKGWTFLELTGADAARYEKLAMDAAWEAIAVTAGADISAELRAMLER